MRKILILSQKLITTFYRRVIVLAHPLDTMFLSSSLPSPVEIAELDESALPGYTRFRPEQDSSMIRRRMAAGDRCFILRSNGKIVHSGWVCTGTRQEPYLRCTLRLPPGDIFLYDHYTCPSCRGQGFSQARDLHVMARYRELGFRRSIAIVAIENKLAFRPFQALGYTAIGEFLSLWWIAGKKIHSRQWGLEPLPIIESVA
jgi:hypothetical protein